MSKTIKKRKGLPKKSNKNKNNLLFDFLNDITWEKKDILDSMNDYGYDKFMITRFLSMHESYLPIVDYYLNVFQGCLDNKQFHQACISLIPKKKVYLKYIRSVPDKNRCKKEIRLIADYFKISDNDAYDYYVIAGDELVGNIERMYGFIE